MTRTPSQVLAETRFALKATLVAPTAIGNVTIQTVRPAVAQEKFVKTAADQATVVARTTTVVLESARATAPASDLIGVLEPGTDRSGKKSKAPAKPQFAGAAESIEWPASIDYLRAALSRVASMVTIAGVT